MLRLKIGPCDSNKLLYSMTSWTFSCDRSSYCVEAREWEVTYCTRSVKYCANRRVHDHPLEFRSVLRKKHVSKSDMG